MPRRRADKTPVVIPTTALVASATHYQGKVERIYQARADWQTECYRHYSICGEARFAARFFGHAVSRAILSAAEMVKGVAVEATSGAAYDALAALFNGADGQKEMLDAIGVHLTIAGECYLVGRSDPAAGDVWEIVSVVEMEVTGNKWRINYADGRTPIELTDDDVVIRIWLPAPDKKMQADSPFKSLLPILAEIEWLTRHVFAQVTSRLAGAGILLMPQGMSFPPAPSQNGEQVETANEADAFMATLAEAMLTPISDPGSPSAMIPIVATAPDDAIDKPRLLRFWSELDIAAKDLRNEAIRRFALGMDLPPEQVTGMGNQGGTGGGRSNGISHWGAWQVEEATIKMHIEPMLDVIVNALTIGYLRPLLGDEGAASVIVYNTSALRLRPDRSKDAFELFDRGLISPGALLRETGFDDDDLMKPEEFQRWLLVKIATGSATPEQMQAALGQLGVHLPVAAPGDQNRPTPPPPSLEDHPVNPRTPNESALIAASEALVFRALERAGNRLRQAGGKPPGVPAFETHVFVKAARPDRLLDDAWSCAPQVLSGIADPERIVTILDSYCQSLIAEQSRHSRDRMVNWLRLAEEVSA